MERELTGPELLTAVRDRDPWKHDDFLLDPHPHYRAWRDEPGLHFSVYRKSWVVTDYATCTQVLCDNEGFVRDPMPVPAIDVHDYKTWMLFDEGEKHRSMRRSLGGLLEGLTEVTTAEAEARCTEAARTGRLNFGPEFARPVLIKALNHYVGVPDCVTAEMVRRLAPANMTRVFREVLQENSGGPACPGAAGRLADVESVPLDQRASNLGFLWFAGVRGTELFLFLGLLELLRQPARLREQIADEAERGWIVDELLRLTASNPLIRFHVVQPRELRGQPLRPGQKLILSLQAANRDPAVFPDPDLARPRPNQRHLAFGVGRHACAGGNVARVTSAAALGTLFKCLPQLRLDPQDPPIFETSFLHRVPTRLSLLL